eukprot:TRINITY_DN7845_c0_g2_i1.p1 TRINITY_DN7845_c0_g2~~TRINITY_DN7845_c0_g2_i1.p1  ORF type:complete len:396 (+),score=83.35 TRINITY_DN7845_c0_g2_i1:51-1238(+)
MTAKCLHIGRQFLAKNITNRYFGRGLCQSSVLHGQNRILLEDHSLKVPSFGGVLWVNSNVKVSVKPVNTLEDLHMDKAAVKVYGVAKDLKEKYTMDVKQEGHKLTVNTNTNDESIKQNINCVIEVPLVHNVNIVGSGDAPVKCKDMVESNYCHLTSDKGEISVERVKTANLSVQSAEGDVFCRGAIQGSISVVTGEGNVVNDKRFLGPSLDITTDSGDIRVASCYSDQSKFSTNTGSLFLRNLHNESYVAVYEKGNVTMQGVDGSTNVFVKDGDVDIQVSKVGHESRIHVEEGDITLKLTDTFPLKVCVTANEIILDTKFSQYGNIDDKKYDDGYKHYFGTIQPEKFSPTLQVVAENGRVIVESQDWAASLGFKLPGGIDLPPDLNIKQANLSEY